jgi:uncharacterized glyoxalase superfamily protein PhnB
MESLQRVMTILYVADQRRSTEFYRQVLGREPNLDVPGMTEFELVSGCRLGLMPEVAIRRLLGPVLPDPAQAGGVPRVELYVAVADAAACYSRALDAGATELSRLQPRDWGDSVAYCLDPDGHVLAFCQEART